jgi:hypothetical protein
MPTDEARVRHEPLLYSAGRYGSWGGCLCGRWRSRTWTAPIGAHIEFGGHLLAEHRRTEGGSR